MTNSLDVSAIILDCLGILLCTFAVCMSLFVLLFIFLRRERLKSKDKILYLLSINMYTCIMTSALFIGEMYISMLYGHLHPTTTNLNTFWCRFKAYVMYIFSISIFHSCTLQALYRLFRIIYYTRPYLYRNIYLYLFLIACEIPMSALQALPHFLSNGYPYIDYHCQISLQSWSELLLGAVLFWAMPVSIIIGIYLYTMYYIRQSETTVTLRRQNRMKRDAMVLARIFWLTIFVVFCGIPPCTLAIIYYISGYFGWWTNHFEWYTSVFSFIGVGLTHLLLAPHLRILWSRITVRPINSNVALVRTG